MIRWALIAGVLMWSQNAAMAEGSPDAGKSKATVCTACHGADGNSVNPIWPTIAGQNQRYMIAQLEAFKSGARSDPLMSSQAINLSQQDMEDLAAWYTIQAPTVGEADPELVALGQRIYMGGNIERNTSACYACHGPTGRGVAPAGYPSLQGQKADYIVAQLNAYFQGDRTTDEAQVMRNVASTLTEADMRAVASYIQGLQ